MKIYKCGMCRKNYHIFPSRELKKYHSHNYRCFICGKYYNTTPLLPKDISDVNKSKKIWLSYLENHPDLKFYNLIRYKIEIFIQKNDVEDKSNYWITWLNNFYQNYAYLDVLNLNYISKSRR